MKRLTPNIGVMTGNARKYFARGYDLSLIADERWLARASDALVAHWATRNLAKKKKKQAKANPALN